MNLTDAGITSELENASIILQALQLIWDGRINTPPEGLTGILPVHWL